MATWPVKAGVILADCPWKYRNFSDTAHGAARAHYDSMTYEELAAIPVADLADRNCVLLMWGTWPQGNLAYKLMEAWGFTHVCGLPWVKVVPTKGPSALMRKTHEAAAKDPTGQQLIVPIKPKTGTGCWWQSASEFLIGGVRGSPKKNKVPLLALMSGQDRNTFFAPIGKHSKKPPEMHEWVEKKMPIGPYVELFATENRPGWTCYGRSIGTELGPWGVRSCAPTEKRVVPLTKAQRAAGEPGLREAHPPQRKPRRAPAVPVMVGPVVGEALASARLDGETHLTTPACAHKDPDGEEDAALEAAPARQDAPEASPPAEAPKPTPDAPTASEAREDAVALAMSDF